MPYSWLKNRWVLRNLRQAQQSERLKKIFNLFNKLVNNKKKLSNIKSKKIAFIHLKNFIRDEEVAKAILFLKKYTLYIYTIYIYSPKKKSYTFYLF